MAEENTAQESGQIQEQEPEQAQGEEPVQEQTQEPAEPRQDKPDKEKRGGDLALPILYALLAAVGAFTLIMIIGIVVTFITRPPESPPAETSSQSSLSSPSPTRAQTQSPPSPDSGGDHTASAPRGPSALSGQTAGSGYFSPAAGEALGSSPESRPPASRAGGRLILSALLCAPLPPHDLPKFSLVNKPNFTPDFY